MSDLRENSTLLRPEVGAPRPLALVTHIPRMPSEEVAGIGGRRRAARALLDPHPPRVPRRDREARSWHRRRRRRRQGRGPVSSGGRRVAAAGLEAVRARARRGPAGAPAQRHRRQRRHVGVSRGQAGGGRSHDRVRRPGRRAVADPEVAAPYLRLRERHGGAAGRARARPRRRARLLVRWARRAGAGAQEAGSRAPSRPRQHCVRLGQQARHARLARADLDAVPVPLARGLRAYEQPSQPGRPGSCRARSATRRGAAASSAAAPRLRLSARSRDDLDEPAVAAHGADADPRARRRARPPGAVCKRGAARAPAAAARGCRS